MSKQGLGGWVIGLHLMIGVCHVWMASTEYQHLVTHQELSVSDVEQPATTLAAVYPEGDDSPMVIIHFLVGVAYLGLACAEYMHARQLLVRPTVDDPLSSNAVDG